MPSDPEPVFLRPAVIYLLGGAALVLWGVAGALTLAGVLDAAGAILGIGVAIMLSFGATALGCLSWLERRTRQRQERILAVLVDLGEVHPDTLAAVQRLALKHRSPD